jgi:hypothetical protein
MSQQFLDGADIRATVEQAGGEIMMEFINSLRW